MNLSIAATLRYHFHQPTDVLLQIETAPLADQILQQAHIQAQGAPDFRRVAGGDGIGERIWLAADGLLDIGYSATIAIDRPSVALETLGATAPRALPGEVVGYLMPSRYCPSDRFGAMVDDLFGTVEGGAKIAAMRNWIAANIRYEPSGQPGASDATDTLLSRRGVCRDYTHLLVSLARAADIPARYVSCYGLGVTPQDFHAVAAVWLEGAWHLVDATGMTTPETTAIIAVGRDAGEVPFLSTFGWADYRFQEVTVTAG